MYGHRFKFHKSYVSEKYFDYVGQKYSDFALFQTFKV